MESVSKMTVEIPKLKIPGGHRQLGRVHQGLEVLAGVAGHLGRYAARAAVAACAGFAFAARVRARKALPPGHERGLLVWPGVVALLHAWPMAWPAVPRSCNT